MGPSGRRRERRLRRAVLWGLSLFGLVLVGLASGARSQEADLDVLKVLPQNYTLVLENPLVRVIEARIPAGSEERPHRHLKGVSVAMGDYNIEHRDQAGSGKWVRSQRKLGTVYWSESGVHETRNVGTTASHTIRIELKF
jgi:hypothetical protein